MIGILGGYGSVGEHCTIAAANAFDDAIVIGGRNKERALNILSSYPNQVTYRYVDVTDVQSISDFLEGVDLLINCAAPSYKTSKIVAEQAEKYGTPYVDAGLPARFGEWRETFSPSVPMVFGAGCTPGVSGMFLHRILNLNQDASRLNYYYTAFGRLSYAAAYDYLYGVCDRKENEPFSWKNGSVSFDIIPQKTNFSLPFIEQELIAQPFFDDEIRYCAENSSLVEGNFYCVVSSDRGLEKMRPIFTLFRENPSLAAEKLSLMSGVNNGLSYIRYYGELQTAKGESKLYSLYHANSEQLTGITAAACAKYIFENKSEYTKAMLPAEVSSPDRITEILKDEFDIEYPEEFSGTVDSLTNEEYGEL